MKTIIALIVMLVHGQDDEVIRRRMTPKKFDGQAMARLVDKYGSQLALTFVLAATKEMK